MLLFQDRSAKTQELSRISITISRWEKTHCEHTQKKGREVKSPLHIIKLLDYTQNMLKCRDSVLHVDLMGKWVLRSIVVGLLLESFLGEIHGLGVMSY